MRNIRRTLVMLLLLVAASHAKSFVSVTTWPSFRLGNDLGRFDWYLDVQFSAYGGSDYNKPRNPEIGVVSFSPSMGCDYQLYDSLFRFAICGVIGTLLEFENSDYINRTNIDLAVGCNIEWPFARKLSVIGELLLGGWITVAPDDPRSYYDVMGGFNIRPSLQFRYYIGPAQ